MSCRSWLAVLVSIALTTIALGSQSAVTAADPLPPRITVATWNLEWFFDEYAGDNFSKLAKEQSAPTRADWNWKRDGVAAAIARMQPTILAVQEVECQRTLWYLTQRLKSEHQLEYRIAFIQGSDHFTEQDVAILYRHGLVEFARREQTAAQSASRDYYNVQKHLLATFEWSHGGSVERLTLVNVHFRASSNAASVRRRQARLVRSWVTDLLRDGRHVIVLGDLNTEQLAGDRSADATVGILTGQATTDDRDDLIDLTEILPASQRNTHLMRGKQFDRVLISKSLTESPTAGLRFHKIRNRRDLVVRGNGVDEDHRDVFYEIPAAERNLSDHYPLTIELLRR